MLGLTCGQHSAFSVMSKTEWMSFNQIDDVVMKKYGNPNGFWFNTLASMEKRGVVERLPKPTNKDFDLWRLK